MSPVRSPSATLATSACPISSAYSFLCTCPIPYNSGTVVPQSWHGEDERITDGDPGPGGWTRGHGRGFSCRSGGFGGVHSHPIRRTTVSASREDEHRTKTASFGAEGPVHRPTRDGRSSRGCRNSASVEAQTVLSGSRFQFGRSPPADDLTSPPAARIASSTRSSPSRDVVATW